MTYEPIETNKMKALQAVKQLKDYILEKNDLTAFELVELEDQINKITKR